MSRTKKTDGALKILQGVELQCPFSEWRHDGSRIKRHMAVVRLCKTGTSLFIVCNAHAFRGFCTEPTLVKRCLDAADFETVA